MDSTATDGQVISSDSSPPVNNRFREHQPFWNNDQLIKKPCNQYMINSKFVPPNETGNIIFNHPMKLEILFLITNLYHPMKLEILFFIKK